MQQHHRDFDRLAFAGILWGYVRSKWHVVVALARSRNTFRQCDEAVKLLDGTAVERCSCVAE